MRLRIMSLVVSLAVVVTVAGVVRPSDAAARSATDAVCRFEDPDFGAHAHALDIETVTVTRSSDAALTFELTFVRGLRMRDDMGFLVAIDTDRSNATGDESGDEYLLGYQETNPPTPAELDAWRDGAWVTVPSAGVRFTHDGQGVVFRVPSAAIGAPRAFDFTVAAATGVSTDTPDTDRAPQREHVLVTPDTWEWSFPSCARVDIGQSTEPVGRTEAIVFLVMFVGGAIVGGAVAGWVATTKGRRVALWAVLGVFFPLVAIAVVALLPSKRSGEAIGSPPPPPSSPPSPPPPAGRTPETAGVASVCRTCGRRLDAADSRCPVCRTPRSDPSGS